MSIPQGYNNVTKNAVTLTWHMEKPFGHTNLGSNLLILARTENCPSIL
jgi:hypothetical protein